MGIMGNAAILQACEMKEKTLNDLLSTAVDFERDSDHDLIRRLYVNYALYKEIPESRMSPEVIDSLLRSGIVEFAPRVPKHLWTDYFIQMTIMRPEMRHLMDPSLVTDLIIEELGGYGYEFLKHLPYDKHPYEIAFKAVMENVEWINYINPDFIPDIVKHVSGLESAKLGGFASIKDALNIPIKKVLISFCGEHLTTLSNHSEKSKSLLRIYKYRLESMGKSSLIDLCVKYNTPDALSRLYGGEVAAIAFPKVDKRRWLSNDLGI